MEIWRKIGLIIWVICTFVLVAWTVLGINWAT